MDTLEQTNKTITIFEEKMEEYLQEIEILKDKNIDLELRIYNAKKILKDDIDLNEKTRKIDVGAITIRFLNIQTAFDKKLLDVLGEDND